MMIFYFIQFISLFLFHIQCSHFIQFMFFNFSVSFLLLLFFSSLYQAQQKSFCMYSMYVLSHFSHVQLIASAWTVAGQAPLSIGFSSQEHWSEVPCPPLGDLPNPGIKPRSPSLQADSLLSESLGKTFITLVFFKCCLLVG